MKVAAFVMTFERPEILQITLKRILEQTLPPELILVVDNSYSSGTKQMIEKKFPEVVYHRMGYNGGPAGAAKVGLQKLTKMGFDWIYWGDDDNPPRDKEVFNRSIKCIRKLLDQNVNVGVFGGKGGKFNKITGRIKSLSNKELLQGELLLVDTVPGGHDMFVNSQVIKKGVLPDEKLFFGFEEFDFCLKVTAASFKIFIDAATWLEERKKSGRADRNYRWKSSAFGNRDYISREFYSSRNLLFIFYRRKFLLPLLIIIAKMLIKMPLSFKYGWNYGLKMSRGQLDAMAAFLKGEFGNEAILVKRE